MDDDELGRGLRAAANLCREMRSDLLAETCSRAAARLTELRDERDRLEGAKVDAERKRQSWERAANDNHNRAEAAEAREAKYKQAMLDSIYYIRMNRDGERNKVARDMADNDVAIVLNEFHAAGGTVAESDNAALAQLERPK